MKVILSVFGPTAPGETASQIARGIRGSGANALLFFTSLYHGYRLIQPRYPNRAIYSLETDRLFYEPDMALYNDCSLKPQRSIDAAGTDYLAELVPACHDEGVEFSALMPVCAAEILVQSRPDTAVVNLYGSRDRLFMCHNNPDVRAYRMAMVRDIVSRYDIDALMLDKIPQQMLELQAMSGIFDPHLRTVGSFCFCEHCKLRARESGLDLEEVRARCLEIAANSLRIPQHIIHSQREKLTGDTEIPLLMLEEPLVRRMIEFRFETAVELVGQIAALARKLKPGITVQAAFVPPTHIGHDMTSPRAWLATQSYKIYAQVLDEMLCVVHWDEDVVRFETHRAVASAGGARVITSMRLYGATRPEEVARLADAALAGGSQGVSFLGYDTASSELLAALKAWSDSRGAADA